MPKRNEGFKSPVHPMYVKVQSGRGHGDGLWKVVGIRGNEYQLENNASRVRMTIYAALTYQDIGAKRMSFAAKMNAVSKIGAKK